MEHCNHDIISDTQPIDSLRCSPCKCPDGYWLNYLNEETNRGDLKLNRGTGYGPYGNSDSCLGTELGTLESGYAFSYNVLLRVLRSSMENFTQYQSMNFLINHTLLS